MTSLANASLDDMVREIKKRAMWGSLLSDINDDEIMAEMERRELTYCFHQEPEETDYDGRTIEDAYKALTPSTPEPIREIILELAGRIA